MKKRISRLNTGLATALLRPINTSAIILLGIYTVVWGIWIVNPFWTVFTQAGLYSAMASLMPEFIWGIVALAAGAVICYGVLRPSHMRLLQGSFVGFVHWFLIAIFYFFGDWQNTGGITALFFAIYAAFIFVNLKVNKRLYKSSEKHSNETLRKHHSNDYSI